MGKTTRQIAVLNLGLSLPVAAWARSEGEPQSRTKPKEKAKGLQQRLDVQLVCEELKDVCIHTSETLGLQGEGHHTRNVRRRTDDCTMPSRIGLRDADCI